MKLFKNRTRFVIFSTLFLLLSSCFDGENLRDRDEIVFAIYSKPDYLSMKTLRDVSVYNILNPIHLGLVTTNFKGDIFSGAAKRWSIGEDNLSYMFNLKEDIKFSNGKKFDCSVVKFNFDRITKFYQKSAGVINIKSYSCLKTNTFKIELFKYSNIFLQMLAELRFVMVEPGEFSNSKDNIVGLGPYTLESNDKSVVTLRLNENHFMAMKGQARIIKYQHKESISEAILDYNKNKIDIVDLKGFPLNHKETSSMYYSRHWMLTFGKKVELAKKMKLNYGIRRSKVIDAVKHIYIPAYGASPPYTPGYIKGLDTSKDLPSFEKKKLDLMVIKNLVPNILLEGILKEMTELGFAVNVQKLTKNQVIKKFFSGNYDVWLGSFAVGLIPEILANVLYNVDTYIPLIQAKEKNVSMQNELSNIETEVSNVQRDEKLRDFLKQMFKKSLYIPLFFQKTIFLRNKCIDMTKYSLSSSTENLREIRIKDNCKR